MPPDASNQGPLYRSDGRRPSAVIARSPQGDAAIQSKRRIPSPLDRRVASLLAMTTWRDVSPCGYSSNRSLVPIDFGGAIEGSVSALEAQSRKRLTIG